MRNREEEAIKTWERWKNERWEEGEEGENLKKKAQDGNRRRKKKKKGLDFKSSDPNSGTPDDLGHVTLPSVPSVWPVNIPLTPVKTWHSSFPTHRGAAVITPSPRDPETRTKERKRGREEERGGENLESQRRDTARKGSDLFLQQPIFTSCYCYQCITPWTATRATITPLNRQSIIIGQRGVLTPTSCGALACNWLHS